MSRIAGLLQAPTPAPHLVQAMGHALAGAGPRGGVARGRAALLAQGRYGASASLGQCVAVIDGCFCNLEELPQAGSSAEQLLHLYARHGFEGALRRVCGDFAVALYDAGEDVLWLARDRVGTRPLYYAIIPDGVGFASRPAALLALPQVPPTINTRFAALFAASHYRTIDNDPHASPYAAIRQLPAAHMARVRGGDVQVVRWWSLVDAPDMATTEDEQAEQYRVLLLQAVGERLRVADRPAFTLSGGMDSSSVLASVVHLTGNRQHAFSTVYDDKTYDESDEIASMLEANVKCWHPVRIGDVDLVPLIRQMVAAHDEPVATATWLSHWLLCDEVRQQGFGTLFGGLGGDELNAGEYEYFFFHFADLLREGNEAALTREIAGWAKHHDHPLWRKNEAVARAGIARLADFGTAGRCLPDRVRIERYRAALRPEVLDLQTFEPVMESPFSSYLKNRTWQDIYAEAAPCCLRAEDRQTRAHGLVNMDPFYDHRLMEFMFRVPGSNKIRNGVTKHLLRKAMHGMLPEETRLRVKKTGWNAPAHVWFTGAQAEEVRMMVESPQFCGAAFYDVHEVLRLLDEHCAVVESGAVAENHMMFFWQLVNLEVWLESHRAWA